jgi:hypothetical protein
MSEEEWVKEGPTILQGILDKRRKVQVISLAEAVQLEKTQQPPMMASAARKPPTNKNEVRNSLYLLNNR